MVPGPCTEAMKIRLQTLGAVRIIYTRIFVIFAWNYKQSNLAGRETVPGQV